MHARRWLMASVAAIGAGLVAAAPLPSAGPPLICLEFQCEGESLPMGGNPLQTKKGYNVNRLDKDVVKLLDDADSVIDRMETIRRATLYVNRKSGDAESLFTTLSWRALDAETTADTHAYADALFDAGYLAATLANYGIEIKGAPGAANDIAGYAWINRAITLADDDPTMHFAAGLAAHPVMRKSKRDDFERHIAFAAAGANDDPLLEKNLNAHMEHFGESVDRIVKSAEARDAKAKKEAKLETVSRDPG